MSSSSPVADAEVDGGQLTFDFIISPPGSDALSGMHADLDCLANARRDVGRQGGMGVKAAGDATERSG